MSTHAPLHDVCPAAQPHVPSEQTSPVAQWLPQLPQFWASVFSSMQPTPAQKSGALLDGHAQAPDRHTCVCVQATPHAPQFWLSSARDTQPAPAQKLLLTASEHWQAPFLHARPAPQSVPQAPQFCESLVKSAQPVAHTVAAASGQEHFPELQVCSGKQAFPQAPQFDGSSFGTVMPLQTRQSSTLPLQSLSMPSPHTSLSANLRHAQSLMFVPSSLVRQAQLSAAGQFMSLEHAVVHTPPVASTRTHSPEAQSSVFWHAWPKTPVPSEALPAPELEVQPPSTRSTPKQRTAHRPLSLISPVIPTKVPRP